MSRATANLLLLLAGVIWGMAFIAQSTAMDDIGPLQFSGIRFLLAFIAVLPFVFWEKRRKPKAKIERKYWPTLLIISVCFFLGHVLQQIGIIHTSVTNAGFLTAAYVVLTPFFVLFFFKGRPDWVIWPAAFLTLIGIYLLSGGDLSALNIGDALMIVAAVFWALQVIYLGNAAHETGRPITIAAIQFLFIGVFATGLGLIFEEVSLAAIQAAAVELLFAGVLSGSLAFTLQAIAQQWTRPSDAAIFLSTEAPFAAIFAAIMLGERIPPIGLFGCALIFTAVLLTELGPLYLKQRKAKHTL